MKEEITDLISPKAIQELKVGKVLVFDYEGSRTYIKITRKDTKAMRMWGQRIEMADLNAGMSHYEHELDRDEATFAKYEIPFCNDCQLPVSDPATEEGNIAAYKRTKGLEVFDDEG